MNILEPIKIILQHSIFIPTARAADSGSSNVITLLGLNWKLFIAQLINFGVVLLVFWKWVFGPLGKKMAERTEKIERSIQQAKEIEQKHHQAESARLSELERARKDAAEIILKAEKIAGQSKEDILKEARTAAEKIAEQNQLQMAEQHLKLMSEVREEAASLVVLATEKVLREKLDPKKDAQLIKESLKNI